MIQMYYKIPAQVAESLGLTGTLIRHPDGAYLATRAVMARIHPDTDEALRISGGIALTPDQARDDQMKLAEYPLPGATDAAAPQEAGGGGSPVQAATDAANPNDIT